MSLFSSWRFIGSVCAPSPPLNLERRKADLFKVCSAHKLGRAGFCWHFFAIKGGGIHHQGEGYAVQEGESIVAGSVEEHEVQRGRAEHSHLYGREPGPDAARLRRRRQAGARVRRVFLGMHACMLWLCRVVRYVLRYVR